MYIHKLKAHSLAVSCSIQCVWRVGIYSSSSVTCKMHIYNHNNITFDLWLLLGQPNLVDVTDIHFGA